MKTLYFLGALVLVSAVSAGGQERVLRLTLDEAIETARRQRPAYRRALNSRNASGASVRASWGALLPTLDGSISTSATRSTRSVGEGDFGEVVEQPTVSFTTSGSSQSLGASVTLFDGLQKVNDLRAARSDAAVAFSGASVQQTELIAAVSTQFYETLRWQELIAVEEELLRAAQDGLDVTQRFFAVAARDQIDVLGARVDVARAEQSLATASAEAERAALNLRLAMGLEIAGRLEPIGTPPAVFDPSLLDIDALVQRAFQSNPLVGQSDAQVAAARHRSASAKGAWLPSISASGSFGRSVNGDEFRSFLELNPTDNRNLGFSISASIPIFDGFQRAQAVASANETARNAEESRREARLSLERDVRAAYITLQNRYQSLQIQEQSAALAQERVDLSREQYQLAALDFTDFQQIVEQNANAQRSLVDAQFDFVAALVELERTVGEPVRP